MTFDTLNEIPMSQQNRACQQLRNDILEGELAPLSKLQISNLKDRYATSVGPVREALSRLTAEGLVIKRVQRGPWVAPVSVDEFRHITHLRLMLEVDALQQSIGNGDLEWEAIVVGAMHRLKSVQNADKDDLKSFVRNEERENRAFHKALISRCPSDWQLRFIDSLYDQTARYRRFSALKHADEQHIQQKEHEGIMKAALARDTKAACQALVSHIEKSAVIVTSTIA
jgi:DNA-binding GntR family transcriptional regulator